MNIRDKEYAEQIIQTLANRYKGKAVPHTLEEIVNENTDLPISWLNNFCMHFYGEKLTKHMFWRHIRQNAVLQDYLKQCYY